MLPNFVTEPKTAPTSIKVAGCGKCHGAMLCVIIVGKSSQFPSCKKCHGSQVLPMGWTNSLPVFSTATKTIADIANAQLSSGWLSPSHLLDDLAASVSAPPHEAYWGSKSTLLPEPYPACDPSLPMVGAPAAYVEVFVDDFVGLAQKHKQRIRRTLLEAVNEVFCPLSPTDSPT